MHVMRLAYLAMLIPACAVSGDDSETSETALSMSPADAAAVVALVNYPGTTQDTLDNAVGLDTRAAKNIIAQRNGADGVAPSPDDVLFADVAAVDHVPYVGDLALSKLRVYAAAHPAPAGETVEGVVFAGWESEAVVWGVNHATVELGSLLDSRGAAGLLAKRPFTSVAQMGPVPYVAKTALTALRTNARAWWNASHQPAGFVLTADALAQITDTLKQNLWDDEGFVTFVQGLANHDDALTTKILNGLAAEIDRLAAPLVGTRYFDEAAAAESVDNAAPVKQRTKIGGWTYLESIGIQPS
jgi:hypothetical protein